MALDVAAVLDLSRELQQAANLRELLRAARAVVRRTTPYRTVWLGTLRDGTPRVFDLLAVSGDGEFEELAFQQASSIPVEGDPMMEEIFAATHPVVVVDARTDPRTNKAMVEQLGNRTIINVPLIVGDQRIGALGTGTYHPDPPNPPSAEVLELLVVFATQIAAAFQRIQMADRQRELERELERARRIESVALLAGGVAHDFNNLLTAILSGLTFIGEGPLTAAQREDLDSIADAGQRASQLTRHLLAMGRRATLQLIPVDVGACLRAVHRLLRRLIPEEIDVVVDVPDGLPRVLADEGQLDQLFMNLCLNARDAMPDGGKLTLRARLLESAPEAGPGARVHRPGPHLRVDVIDTGHGMSPEVRERIFEPFFTTKAAGKGTGIGLAVAAGVAEQHGGSIRCESGPGAGTTFSLLLPVWAGGSVQQPRPAPRSDTRGTERILIADDDPVVRQMMERVLAHAGYRIALAEDGLEAIERASHEPFDLVVLDAVMPAASGREAWERIRAVRPGARFLVVSGHAAELFPSELRAEAGLPFLGKPFRPEQLLRAVRDALDGVLPGLRVAS